MISGFTSVFFKLKPMACPLVNGILNNILQAKCKREEKSKSTKNIYIIAIKALTEVIYNKRENLLL